LIKARLFIVFLGGGLQPAVGNGRHAALKALGIPAVDVVFEMPRHGRAATVTLIETCALFAGVDAQVTEGLVDLGTVPDLLKTAGAKITGLKTVALQKSAGIHVTGRTDATGKFGRTAEIETQPLALLCRQRKEAVAGAHIAAFCQPVGKVQQLCRGWSERFPVVRATSGRTKPADSK